MLVRSVAEWQADGWRGKAAERRATRLEAGVLVSLLEGLSSGRENRERVWGAELESIPPAVSWVSFGGSSGRARLRGRRVSTGRLSSMCRES